MEVIVGDLVRCQANELMQSSFIGKVVSTVGQTVHVRILNYEPQDSHIVYELMQRIIVNVQQLHLITINY